MTTSGMMAAVAAAAGIGEDQVPSLTIDAAFISAHFADAAAALRAEGAEAEHKRLAGIEAASMPGHDAIIAAHKADRSKTPADAALAVIAAEKAVLASAKSSLETDEQRLAGLTAAASPADSSGAGAGNPHVAARAISESAVQYMNEQSAKGITVSVAEAVAHITKKG